RLLDVVARQQDGDPEFLVHPGDEVPKHPPRVRIEADRRFVHEHDLRLMQQRQRDLELLAHACGKGLHPILAPVVESKVRQEAARALFPLREALQLRLEPEALPRREVVIEDDLGGDPTDPLLHVHRIPSDVVSRDPRVALRHVRPEELPGRTEFSEQRGPLRADRRFEGAEALLDLLAAAPEVGLAFARDPVRLAAFLAAHGQISLPQEGAQRRIDRPGARLVESVVPFLDRLDDLVSVHRVFFEQVEDEAFEVALAEEMEESAEFLRTAHDANSFRRNRRIPRTAPTTAYAAKTSNEVAGSG